MKRAIAVVLGLAIVCLPLTKPAVAETASQPDITANAAVLMEVETGQILYAKNENEKLPMASTTKVMTALLAIENGDLNEIIVVPKEGSGVEGSSMYLEVGEHISLENLLYGLMMWSGNDAAVTIALHIGGSIENFAQMMNQKAKEIGATNTNFVNPNGLPDDNHYTTASDLAKIAVYAMKNETFRSIVSTEKKVMAWEGHEWDRSLNNKNKMLYQYEGANGVKTGYTKAAGRCLVSAANRDDIQLVAVVLNCQDMYVQSGNLLDYGFEVLEKVSVVKAGDKLGEIPVMNGIEANLLEITAQNDIVYPIQEQDKGNLRTNVVLEEKLTAPIQKGQAVGNLEVYLNDQLLQTQELQASADINPITYGYFIEKVLRDWTGLDAAN